MSACCCCKEEYQDVQTRTTVDKGAPQAHRMDRDGLEDDKRAVAWIRTRSQELASQRSYGNQSESSDHSQEYTFSEAQETGGIYSSPKISAKSRSELDHQAQLEESPVSRPSTDSPDEPLVAGKPSYNGPVDIDTGARPLEDSKILQPSLSSGDELDQLVMSISERETSFELDNSKITAIITGGTPPTSSERKKQKTLSPRTISPSKRDTKPVKLQQQLKAEATSRNSPTPELKQAATAAAIEQINKQKKIAPKQTTNDALSDIPSDIDEITKERYLMACRILRSTLIEKETTLLPTEKSFLQGLLDNETPELSEEQITAIETASNTLVSDPIFQLDSVHSSMFQEHTERAPSPAVSYMSAKTLQVGNKRSLLDEEEKISHVESHIAFGRTDIPFKILGIEDQQPSVLTPRLMEALRGFFPYSVSEENFWLRFSVERDGASLSSLLTKVRTSKHTILGLETKDGYVFGAFCATPWRVQPNWFGSGECFLWRLKNSRLRQGTKQRNYDYDNEMEVYPFTGHDELVQYCTAKTIAVGGGDWTDRLASPHVNEPIGIGLMIDGDLEGGETNACATFNNPRLTGTGSKNSEFEIYSLEVWTVTPCDTLQEAEKLEMHKHFIEEHGVGYSLKRTKNL